MAVARLADPDPIYQPRPLRLEMLMRYSSGSSLKQIGSDMNYSWRTVHWHLSELRDEFDALSLSHAVTIAICRGYLAVDPESQSLFVP